MATSNALPPLVLLLGLIYASLATLQVEATNGKLVAYWGQGDREGKLVHFCRTGLYDMIVIAFVAEFGNFTEPKLDLGNHCSPESGGCRFLRKDIEECQWRGVKVLISIGGGGGNYSLSSEDDARRMAVYLWNNYLGGYCSNRPFGSAILDGVDFDIEKSPSSYWATLALSLKHFSHNLILSAAPQCPFPDLFLGPSFQSPLQTGLFNYVWIQFYNNPPCHYVPSRHGIHVFNIIDAWIQWTTSVPGNPTILFGLPASSDAAGFGGFMPTHVLLSYVLPHIKKASNYGGVMLWSCYYDNMTKYGATIKHEL